MGIEQLVRRYEHDELAQLLLVVEQLEVANALLRTDSIADARAALILLDHHAEIMLNEHCEALFRAGDGRGPSVGRPYKAGERERIARRFTTKVDVAAGFGPLGEGVAAVVKADRGRRCSPTFVHLTRNLSPPIGASRLRCPRAVLRELVGNSVLLPGNPSERDPPWWIPGLLRFDLLLELDQVLGPRA